MKHLVTYQGTRQYSIEQFLNAASYRYLISFINHLWPRLHRPLYCYCFHLRLLHLKTKQSLSVIILTQILLQASIDNREKSVGRICILKQAPSLPSTVRVTVHLSSPKSFFTTQEYSPSSDFSTFSISTSEKSSAVSTSTRPSSFSCVLPWYQVPDGMGFPDISHLNETTFPTRTVWDFGAFSIFAGARWSKTRNCVSSQRQRNCMQTVLCRVDINQNESAKAYNMYLSNK